jgi:Ni,Fe-hydrogenase III component G
MHEEQAILTELAAKFPFLADKVRVTRIRRVFADVPSEKFTEVFDYAVRKMSFSILCTITGLDNGATFGAIYHLARESGVMLNLVTSVPKENPVLQTVTGYFPAADHYEREMNDLFGMKVEGLAPGTRYPLPDDWPDGQYPLRKDWKADMLDDSGEKSRQGGGKDA